MGEVIEETLNDTLRRCGVGLNGRTPKLDVTLGALHELIEAMKGIHFVPTVKSGKTRFAKAYQAALDVIEQLDKQEEAYRGQGRPEEVKGEGQEQGGDSAEGA